ncbi:MAG: PAS domain S-box protein [Candidatus Babeliales bacterium]
MTEQLNCKERELVRANKRFRAILDHAPIGMLMTSGRKIIDANIRVGEMLGYDTKDLIGQSTRIIYDSDETFDYVGRLLAEDKKEFTCRVNMRHSDGVIKEYTLKVTKITDDENVASIYVEFRGV